MPNKTSLSTFILLLISGYLNTALPQPGLINLNPDPDGEPWIAGGVDEKEWNEAFSDAVEFKLPQRRALSKTAALPTSFDNSTHPAFRPIFNQKGGSCAQASGVAYVYTYEINCRRGLSSDIPENQYPYDFTYNFLNSGDGNNGSNTNTGWNIIKAIGVPNVKDYGGFGLGKHTRWVSGYDVYLNGMQNRLKEYFYITIRKKEDIEKMKQWFVDRANGSPEGGCLVIAANATGEVLKKLASGTPEAGKVALVKFGTTGGHAMTIAGYNDQIRYDYNNDGKYTNDVDLNGDNIIDVRDWEIGAALLVNSWGSSWGNNGKAWIMYKVLADPVNNGGIYNNQVHGIYLNEDSIFKPKLTFKLSMSHASRNAVRIRAGYSKNLSATVPSSIKTFSSAFSNCGGAFPMQGSSNSEPIEIGLDISDLLEKSGETATAFFLQVDSKSGTGTIRNFSMIDYTGDQPVEIPYSESVVNFSTGTTCLKIVKQPAPIQIVAPNGNEQWERGRTYQVKWTTSIEDNVKIELLKDGSVFSVIENSLSNSGSYQWSIPEDQILDSSYKICISSVKTPSSSDKSDQAFTIRKKSILELTSPNTREMVQTGSTLKISWQDDSESDLKIVLYKNGVYSFTIADKVNGSDTFAWTIPDSFPSGFDYRIRVTSITDQWRYDESDSDLVIMHQPATAPYVQTFDNFKDGNVLSGSWEQVIIDDDIDWTVIKGPPPSRARQGGTGAQADHSGNGNYLYVESSSPNNPGKLAVLLSPLIDLRNSISKTCSFWVHMFSSDDKMGKLYVDVNANGAWNDSVLYISGNQGDKWLLHKIDLSSYKSDFVQIRFRAQTGTGSSSDICIDDFVAGENQTLVFNHKPVPQTNIQFRNRTLFFQNYEGFARVIALDGTVVNYIDKVTHNSTIDISALRNGTYLLMIDSKVMKFVKSGR